MIHILASPILSFSDHCVNSHECKSFKIILLCWSVRSSLLTNFTHIMLYLAFGKSAIYTPVHATSLPQAVYQISFTYFDVAYERVNTGEDWSILPLPIFCTYLQFRSLLNLDKTLNYRLSLFLFLVVWCGRGERCIFNPPSARLCYNYIQANVVNSITIYAVLVFLSLRIARISDMID